MSVDAMHFFKPELPSGRWQLGEEREIVFVADPALEQAEIQKHYQYGAPVWNERLCFGNEREPSRLFHRPALLHDPETVREPFPHRLHVLLGAIGRGRLPTGQVMDDVRVQQLEGLVPVGARTVPLPEFDAARTMTSPMRAGTRSCNGFVNLNGARWG